MSCLKEQPLNSVSLLCCMCNSYTFFPSVLLMHVLIYLCCSIAVLFSYQLNDELIVRNYIYNIVLLPVEYQCSHEIYVHFHARVYVSMSWTFQRLKCVSVREPQNLFIYLFIAKRSEEECKKGRLYPPRVAFLLCTHR